MTTGRRLVDRNLPDVLMVRVSKALLRQRLAGRPTHTWISVDVTAWKRRLARAINRHLARRRA